MLAAVAGWTAVGFGLLELQPSAAGCDLAAGCSNQTGSPLNSQSTAAIPFGVGVAIVWAGVALGALLWYRRKATGLTTLAGSLVVLLVATYLSGLSIGILFIPADLLGIASLVLLVMAPDQ